MKRALLIPCMLAPAVLFAQGFQVNLHGQKQIGMGTTGTALVQDAASVLFNPGAVAALTENDIQAGMSPLMFKSAFNPSGSDATYNVNNKVATPFTAYAVWGPKGAKWKAGLGVYTPFGGLVDWGNSWQGRYVLESLDLKAIYVQPTFSYRINRQWSLGAGLVYNTGMVDLKKALPLTMSDGSDAQAQLKGTGHGWGWNAGVLYRPDSQWSFGLSYRSKVTTTINSGDAVFTVPASLSASFPAGNKFSASIPLPSTTSLGAGYRLNDQWLFALDLSYVRWSVYQLLDFDYANNTSVLADTHSPRNYKDAGSARIGAEFKPIPNFALRAGGGYVLTSVKDGYVTPEAPDANRLLLTAGVGYQIGRHFDINASFLYEKIAARTQTNIESNLSGTYKTNVYAPGLSVAYRW
ncbi:MAG: outer membrane protein transport protein [Chitinophagaceae bacterium]